MELNDIREVSLECLKVERFVDLVKLGDESGASVKHKEEKVNSSRGRAFGTTIHIYGKYNVVINFYCTQRD